MVIKHKFVSLKIDDPDTTLIRPSNWNDEHEIDAHALAALLTDHVESLSSPPAGYYKVKSLYVDAQTGKLIVGYEV